MDLPWEPKTRQQQGRQTEKTVVKKRGGRVHPNSGAGRIKDDGSSDSEVIEVKDANKQHTMVASDLEALYVRAVRQGKDPVYVVRFTNGIEAEVSLRRY